MRERRYSSTILDLGTRWRRMVSFMPQPLYPIGKSLGAHWVGGWVDLRTGLDAVEWVQKSLAPARNRNPAVQPVARRYTD
jgi:hypothetical protein